MQTEVVSEAAATSSGATVQVTTTPSRSELASVGEHDARSDEGLLRKQTFSGIVETMFPPAIRTLADLGAGPCIFARLATDAGLEVTAVDGRVVRVPENLESITFVESDLRDFDLTPFDSVALLGILYHLDIDDQVALIERCRGKALVIDTQVHVPELVTAASGEWAHLIVRRGDYEGVEFPEGDNPMASIRNPKSFWHTEASYLELFRNAGFDSVGFVGQHYVSKYGARRFYVMGHDQG